MASHRVTHSVSDEPGAVQIRWWVDHLLNVLRVGEALRNAASTEESLPKEILELEDVWGRVHDGHLKVGTARWIFGQKLRSLLMITGVQPVIGWTEATEGPSLSLEGVGVLGLVAVQVMSFLMSSADMRLCAACSEWFILTDRRGSPR